MNNQTKLIYRNYKGSIVVDKDGSYYGKVEDTREDFIAYQGDNLIELIKTFEQAVDDYIVDRPEETIRSYLLPWKIPL